MTESRNRNDASSRDSHFKWILIDLACFAVLVVLDLVTKTIAAQRLKGQDSFVLIPGVFEFRYLENKGAAFSMLQNQQWFFYVIATAACAVIAWLLVKIPTGKRYRALRVCLVLIASGAFGNLVDRMIFHYVRDFIYFSLIDFPIFNVADCYVTIATVLLVVLILFVYRESDFAFFRKQDGENKRDEAR